MIINPAPGSNQSLLAKGWDGDSYELSDILTEIVPANNNRIKLLIDNRSIQDCLISFGNSQNPMRLMPDNLWIEIESAAMPVRAKGFGSIFIAEWTK